MKHGPWQRFFEAILLLLILGAVGFWLSRHWWGGNGVEAMVFAGLICFTSALLSLIPMEISFRRKSVFFHQAWMIGSGLRLLLTMVLGFTVYLLFEPNHTAYCIWLLVFYMAFLCWETLVAVRLMRSVKKE